MSVNCPVSAGKGTLGLSMERTPRICAAGVPTAHPDSKVADYLKHYLLQEEADALIRDAIHPPPTPRKHLPLRRPIPKDMRYATLYTDVKQTVFPPCLSKYQTLAEDLKNTVYASYWKPLGETRDPNPMLPAGLDKNTTFGKKLDEGPTLYEVIMPRIPIQDKTPPFKQPGVQKKRGYCESYNPDAIFGSKSGINNTGICMKTCLTDENVKQGITAAVVASGYENFLNTTHPRVGQCLTPYNNVKELPEGTPFGKSYPPAKSSTETFSSCNIYPEKEFIKKCFAHYNSVRKCLTKLFLPEFFHKFYLLLKHYDQEKSGWLSKDTVYEQCIIKRFKFVPSLIEPLLALWQAYDGCKIEYKAFVNAFNYTQPAPATPKIPDMPRSCFNYETTYGAMYETCPDDSFMAGLPSGRYFDRDYPLTPNDCCKADRALLPEESDMKSCMNPSIFTLFNVTHRDMYVKREPEVVRRVFEKIGDKFDDDTFRKIWEDAEKYHSQGWVSFETFRRALMKHQGE